MTNDFDALLDIVDKPKRENNNQLKEDEFNFDNQPKKDEFNFDNQPKKDEFNFDNQPKKDEFNFDNQPKEDEFNFDNQPKKDEFNFDNQPKEDEFNFDNQPKEDEFNFDNQPKEDEFNFDNQPKEEEFNFDNQPKEEEFNFDNQPKEEEFNFDNQPKEEIETDNFEFDFDTVITPPQVIKEISKKEEQNDVEEKQEKPFLSQISESEDFTKKEILKTEDFKFNFDNIEEEKIENKDDIVKMQTSLIEDLLPEKQKNDKMDDFGFKDEFLFEDNKLEEIKQEQNNRNYIEEETNKNETFEDFEIPQNNKKKKIITIFIVGVIGVFGYLGFDYYQTTQTTNLIELPKPIKPLIKKDINTTTQIEKTIANSTVISNVTTPSDTMTNEMIKTNESSTSKLLFLDN